MKLGSLLISVTKVAACDALLMRMKVSATQMSPLAADKAEREGNRACCKAFVDNNSYKQHKPAAVRLQPSSLPTYHHVHHILALRLKFKLQCEHAYIDARRPTHTGGIAGTGRQSFSKFQARIREESSGNQTVSSGLHALRSSRRLTFNMTDEQMLRLPRNEKATRRLFLEIWQQHRRRL